MILGESGPKKRPSKPFHKKDGGPARPPSFDFLEQTTAPAASRRFRSVKLRVVQLSIRAALLQQLLMGACLNDPPLVHHEDAVRAGDGGQPVGDDEAGAAPHQLEHCILNVALGLGVDVGGRLVEDEHGGVHQHGAGDGHQLLLALGDAVAAVGDHGVVAIGQGGDHVVDVRGLGGGDDLLAGGLGAGVGEVVVDRAVKEPCVLKHHGELAAQAVAGQLADVPAVQQDAPAGHVVEAHQQVDERGLAAARFADDGDDLARLGGEGHVVQHGHILGVAEGHVVELHAALAVLEVDGVLAVGGLGGQVEQGQEALGGGEGGLQLADDVRELIDRPGKAPGIQHEGAHAAQRDAAHHVHHRAEHAHRGEGEVVDEVDGRAGDRAGVVGVPCGVDGLVVVGLEAGVELLLLMVGADGLQAGDGLLTVAVQLAQRLGALAEQRPHDPGAVPREQDGGGDGEEEDQDQHRRDGEHHHEAADDGDEAGENLRQVGGERRADGVDVIGEHRDDVAGLMGVEEADGQGGQVIEDLLAHAGDHAAAQTDHDRREQPRHDRGDDRQRDHQQHIAHHDGHVDVAGDDGVDGRAGEPGRHEAQQVTEHAHHRRADDDEAEGAQVFPQPDEHAHGAALGLVGGHAAGSTTTVHAASPPNWSWQRLR